MTSKFLGSDLSERGFAHGHCAGPDLNHVLPIASGDYQGRPADLFDIAVSTTKTIASATKIQIKIFIKDVKNPAKSRSGQACPAAFRGRQPQGGGGGL